MEWKTDPGMGIRAVKTDNFTSSSDLLGQKLGGIPTYTDKSEDKRGKSDHVRQPRGGNFPGK